MAEEQKTTLVREYVIPLRRYWIIIPYYKRASRAVKTIKEFIAKHMKVPERNTDNVKLDTYLNHEIWARGIRSPPSRIKVRATKEGDIVKVELLELPEKLKFLKARHEKIQKITGKESKEKVNEEKKEEKTEEQKKDESEKEKAGEEQQLKESKQEKHTEKHTAKDKKVEIHRRSMNRH
jgi:large subunit ribosomal protein L31e